MLLQDNTRYIIQYDYDLNNQTINIPNKCILEFQGGSLKNGTLNGDFDINSDDLKIFHNIKFQGQCIKK